MSFGYTETATVWTLTLTGGSGPFDPPIETWTRSIIKCEWVNDNQTRKDDQGGEFTPKTLIYTPTLIPKGCRILPGSIADLAPPANAETVRSVDSGSSFANDPIEYIAITG